MVIRELLQKTVDTLKDGNIENAVFDANLIIRAVMNISPLDLVLSYQKKADDEKAHIIDEYTKRRCLGEPLQYILGTQEFMGMEFIVNEDVLIPRADTETLVETVLTKNLGMNVLDICTGSGCIALSIAHFNKNSFVCGIDISESALKVAKKNAEKHNLTERVKFQLMDIKENIPEGIYDVIVSNPPYIQHKIIDTLQTEVKMHEPHIALDGGEDGLDFYRRIADISPKLLQEGGKLFFEVGFDQASEVANILKKEFRDIKTVKDLCGVERVVCGTKRMHNNLF